MKVFLSHSWLDKPFVRLFGEDLRAASLEVWLDEAQLEIGDSLPDEIANAIGSSDYFLAFVSQHSVNSRWVQKELAIATALEVSGERLNVLPLRLDESPMPALLLGKFYGNFCTPPQYDPEFRKILKRIHPQSSPQNEYSFYCLTLDWTRKDRLVQAATAPGMKGWMVEYLATKLQQCGRHIERHFAYLALGEIGGTESESLIAKGLMESNAFARKGAFQAWKQLGHVVQEGGSDDI